MQNKQASKSRPSPLSPAIHLAQHIKLNSSGLKSPGELKNRTQKTAYALLQQEDKHAISSRLECLLVQQFLRKYGSKNAESQINSTIKSITKEFVNSYDDVRKAEAAIGELENNIKRSISDLKASILREKAARAASREAKQRVPSLGSNLPTAGSTYSDPHVDQNQWPVINAIMTVAAEQKQAREAEAARQKQQKYQEELAIQIEKNRQLKERQKQQRDNDLKGVQQELNSFETEQARLRRQKEEHQRMDREMREAQIEENKRIKEQERQMRIAQEQGEMARARRLVAEEEEERRIQRNKQKEAQDNLKLENEHNKAVKAEILRERQNYEKKLNADYEAKLAREEEARTRAFQARMDALASFSKSYESRVGTRLLQEKQDEDRLVNANLAEADRKRAERDKNDYDRRKKTSLQDTEYNIAMIEKKKKAVEDERMEALERRHRMETDALLQKQKDREASEKKRLQMLALKDNLDQQVAQRHTGERNYAALSSIEATINKSITKKLAEDPQLLHKVAERVHASTIQSSRSGPNTERKTGNNIFF
eukprot:CAMPEP_0184980074 /NCGR_PEP_ID=MMETSP1098-20130426/10111_1 /TAXON_ID=89044 /ORGANISM="Spumella elongata, Strain CCAP 955/1" /LENGTH=541 /DNA_ID=CAMNT_0027503433 /DNA_START=50 /DNA_END=1675 /DNA_ORIENTATION=-